MEVELDRGEVVLVQRSLQTKTLGDLLVRRWPAHAIPWSDGGMVAISQNLSDFIVAELGRERHWGACCGGANSAFKHRSHARLQHPQPPLAPLPADEPQSAGSRLSP